MNSSQQVTVRALGSKLPTASNNVGLSVEDSVPNKLLITLFDLPPTVAPTRLPSLNVSTVAPRKPPANAWNHSTQRKRLSHLAAKPPCVCGAGSDVSFLYDAMKKKQSMPPVQQSDKHSDVSNASLPRTTESNGDVSKSVNVSDSLVPEDYHIVKSRGVLGLEYWEDKYTTLPEDHKKHLVVFPSMKPSSRFEVLQLRDTLNGMLDKAGVRGEIDKLTAPTQMHQLLELIKREQNIYNIVFHEIIRQVSVECIERGELLAMVRQLYAEILSQVPKQIKSLHDELLGHRALDQKLTGELTNFHEKVSALISELNSVKEHDKEVIMQAQEVQKDLKAALNEASKNSNALAEYQELYRLQRNRLENEVEFLSDELQQWCDTTFRLASKMFEEHCLNATRQLRVCDKSWSCLASHLTVMLHDRDMSELIMLQASVDSWQASLDEFDRQVRRREDEDVKRVLRLVLKELQEWIDLPDKSRLSSDKLGALVNKMDAWDQAVLEVLANFDGEPVLAGREMLSVVRHHLESWTNSALKILHRREAAGEQHAFHSRTMFVSLRVEKLLADYETRLSGENGVAANLLSVSSGLKVWRARLNVDAPLDVSLKAQLLEQIKQWAAALETSIDNTGRVNPSSSDVETCGISNSKKTIVDKTEVVELARDWLISFHRHIDFEDAELTQQVSVLHQQMLRWTTEAIVSLIPPRYTLSNEALEVQRSKSVDLDQLRIDATSLSVALTDFTKLLTRRFLESIVGERQTVMNDEDHFNRGRLELSRLMSECEQWKTLSEMVLTELASVQVQVQPCFGDEYIPPGMPVKVKSFDAIGSDFNADDDQLEVIGYDWSTRTVGLCAPSNVDDNKNEPTGYKAFEYLRHLQEQLLATEARAQKAEERAVAAEASLIEALGKWRATETDIQLVVLPPSRQASVPHSSKSNQEDTPRIEVVNKVSSKVKSKKKTKP